MDVRGSRQDPPGTPSHQPCPWPVWARWMGGMQGGGRPSPAPWHCPAWGMPWARVRWVMPLPQSLQRGRAGPPSQSGTLMGGCCPGHQASKQGLETWAGVCVCERAAKSRGQNDHAQTATQGDGKEECRCGLGQVVGFGAGVMFPFILCWIDRISYSEDENFLKSLRRITFGPSPSKRFPVLI